MVGVTFIALRLTPTKRAIFRMQMDVCLACTVFASLCLQEQLHFLGIRTRSLTSSPPHPCSWPAPLKDIKYIQDEVCVILPLSQKDRSFRKFRTC
jgi:hypothetical protein